MFICRSEIPISFILPFYRIGLSVLLTENRVIRSLMELPVKVLKRKRDILGDFEVTMSTSALGMHHTLGNTLPVKMGILLEQVQVFE